MSSENTFVFRWFLEYVFIAHGSHSTASATETPATLAKLVSSHERVDFAATDPAIVKGLRRHPGVASITARTAEGLHRVELVESAALHPVLNVFEALQLV